jgi:hypothetical protein
MKEETRILGVFNITVLRFLVSLVSSTDWLAGNWDPLRPSLPRLGYA